LSFYHLELLVAVVSDQILRQLGCITSALFAAEKTRLHTQPSTESFSEKVS
jgi:hypothetical protein